MKPTNHVVSFPEDRIGLVDAYLRGLPSESTRKVYSHVLQAFQRFVACDLRTVGRRHVEAYRSHLEELGRAPSTVCKHFAAISGLYEFAVADNLIDRNPAATARRPRLSTTSPRRALSQEETRKLMSFPERETLIGLRDRALLSMLIVQGWRIAEVLGLQVEDLHEEAGHRVAVVRGKGGKVLRVPLAAQTWTAVQSWVEAAGIDAGGIFRAVTKGGVVGGDVISSQAAWKRVCYLARLAGIERHVHPHVLRHTAITLALANGVPLHIVQDFARHEDPRTTRRYDSHRQSLNNQTPHVLASVLSGEQHQEHEEFDG